MKKIINSFLIFLIFVFITNFSVLFGNPFKNIVQLKINQKVDSFKVDLFKTNIGFAYINNNVLYYTFSLNKGISFEPLVQINKINSINYAVIIADMYSFIIWDNEANKEIDLVRIDHDQNKISFKKKLLNYHGKTVYNFNAIIDNNTILFVYIENNNDHYTLNYIKCDNEGNLLDHKELYNNGYNLLPQIKINQKKYFIVWNSIEGDKENILYTYSLDKGRNWQNVKYVINNDYKNRGAVLFNEAERFFLLWQDNRMGNWNINYVEFKNNEWQNFNSITSGLINYWLPQFGFYMNKLFAFWLDKSDGEAKIYFKIKNLKNKSNWGQIKKINEQINNIDNYQIKSSDEFLLLAFQKNNKVFFSQLYFDPEKNMVIGKEIINNGYHIFWENTGQDDILSYSITISKQKNKKLFFPVLYNSENNFYLYSANKSKLQNLFFNINYCDDIGILSDTEAIALDQNVPSLKSGINKDVISWEKLDADKVFYFIMSNKLYLKINYKKGINKDKILGKLFFYPIHYFDKENSINKNKLIKVFNLINGNIDFDRLIDGDEIYLPLIWSNIFYLDIIKDNADNALKAMMNKYNLQEQGIFYYIVANDLNEIKKIEQAKAGDYLIILK